MEWGLKGIRRDWLGIHIIVWNDISYEIRMTIRWKLSCECHMQQWRILKCRIAKRWLNHSFEWEWSHTRPFSPNVNVNSIQGSYRWAGLSNTTGTEHTEATCHSFRSCEQSAQCSVLTIPAQIQLPDWMKCKWLSYETIMWMSYWYNVVQNVFYMTSYRMIMWTGSAMVWLVYPLINT